MPLLLTLTLDKAISLSFHWSRAGGLRGQLGERIRARQRVAGLRSVGERTRSRDEARKPVLW